MTEAKNPTYEVPATDEEEAAMQKALATRHLQKLQAAQKLFASKAYETFRAKIDELAASNLPGASATRANTENLIRFLDTMDRGIARDIESAEAAVAPPPPPVAAPPPPVPPVGDPAAPSPTA